MGSADRWHFIARRWLTNSSARYLHNTFTLNGIKYKLVDNFFFTLEDRTHNRHRFWRTRLHLMEIPVTGDDIIFRTEYSARNFQINSKVLVRNLCPYRTKNMKDFRILNLLFTIPIKLVIHDCTSLGISADIDGDKKTSTRMPCKRTLIAFWMRRNYSRRIKAVLMQSKSCVVQRRTD